MYLFWLSTFKKIVDEGSYTRAAASLFVSQSAVSQQVRQLEKLFGAKLIQMTGRRLEMTEAGKLVYKFASAVEGEYDGTRLEIDALLGRARRHLVIVSSMPVLLHRLPAVMKRFWAEHPEVSIKTYMRTGDQVGEALRTSFADVAIQTGFDSDDAFEAVPVWADTVAAVCAPEHPLARRSPAANEVAQGRVIIGGGDEIRRLVDDWFEARQARLMNVMELPSFEGLRDVLAESAALAFVPRYAVLEELASGRLCELDIQDFCVSAQTFVIHRPALHEPGRWLVDLLTQQGTPAASSPPAA